MKTIVAAAMLLAAPAAAQTPPPADPHQWLEDVTGEKQLDWVRARNAKYLPELEAVPGFAAWRAKAETILQDPRRIAYPTGASPSGVTAGSVYNFWRDKDHVRGLWRVSPRAAFDAGKPEWTTLLDMDALEAAEKKNLQFSGASCFGADYARCLVRLSIGGKDAVEVREFDTKARRFVPASEGGFASPEAKQALAWLDQDRLLVATAAGPVSTSGYAREVRLWQRGTPFSSAKLLLSIGEQEMAANPAAYGSGANRRAVILQALTFWTGKVHHLGADGALTVSPLPDDANFQFIADVGDGPRAYALLRTDFNGISKGSLVSYAVPASGAPGPVEAVFTPTDSQAIDNVDATGKAVYVNLLDDVAAKLVRLQRGNGQWSSREVPLPANSALGLVATDDQDTLYANVVGFTEPSRLMKTANGAAPTTLASAPAFFDGAKFEVAQRFATSKDGTKVPYFVIRPKGAKGPLKTYYWSYGGFEIALVPAYLQPEAQMWVEAGNQYVVGNIRGGGEYGPRWHQAALLEKRQNSYDDLHAVAEDLKKTGQASKIAVHGRSNGGLMSSVAYTQRPDLYDAALVGVPLADMRRYHLLLAGASWMAEYGNPDTADWEFIKAYSPYQNLKKAAKYPRVFFYTSTKDDRVHPAHARKMAAEMEALGHPIYYYENIDGGHAGVANLKEAAYRYALMLAYLDKELK
ncbi:prolyl oligopeptidase family serine peptidase [Sandaracinobacter sp. RS1-74]|uniref:prolyl oligopeptidase family serine peptidase n=1 Tax=Sandaracinobacteroides sayramensis TaxID=2913411 RepID=UPI001ED9CA84|nr:prolyl oligopeptidase family serine peptidase [Sandaracinobacteroides sayramensis]MCG2840614.1 prolyl oligopeptidase family serine peptidase [Sandaracinobacteroides sayramensis]